VSDLDRILNLIRTERSGIIDASKEEAAKAAFSAGEVAPPRTDGVAIDYKVKGPIERSRRAAHPFQITVEMENPWGTYNPTVHVRHGGFLWKDEEGVDHFVDTTGNTVQANYNTDLVDETTFSLGDQVWAIWDNSGVAPVASLATSGVGYMG